MKATTTTFPSKSDRETSSPNWFFRVKSGASGGFLYSVPSISVPSGPMQPASRKERAKIAALTPADIVPFPSKGLFHSSSTRLSMSSRTSSGFQSVSPHHTLCLICLSTMIVPVV